MSKCEKTKCKKEFDAVKAAGLRENCVIHRDFSQWSNVSKCCQYMKPLGLCAGNSCSKESGDFLSKIGTDVDLDFHLRFSGLFCSCSQQCHNASELVMAAVASGTDAVTLSLEIGKTKAAHPLMQFACSESGWKCFEKTPACTQLKTIEGGINTESYTGKNIGDGLALLGTLVLMYCPKFAPVAATTTTAAVNDYTEVSGGTTSASALVAAWLFVMTLAA